MVWDRTSLMELNFVERIQGEKAALPNCFGRDKSIKLFISSERRLGKFMLLLVDFAFEHDSRAHGADRQ